MKTRENGLTEQDISDSRPDFKAADITRQIFEWPAGQMSLRVNWIYAAIRP